MFTHDHTISRMEKSSSLWPNLYDLYKTSTERSHNFKIQFSILSENIPYINKL